MKKEMTEKFEKLKTDIYNQNISKLSNDTILWAGADVIITDKISDEHIKWLSDQPMVIGLQSTTPMRRIIESKYAKELSWLFSQLKDCCMTEIDFASKYDFYGILAQTVINHQKKMDDKVVLTDLLVEVVNKAEEFCHDENA